MLRTSLFSAIILLLAFMVAPAQAQDASQAPPSEQENIVDPAAQIADDELKSVAAAFVALEDLKATYEARLSEAADDEAAESVKQEMDTAKNETLANAGVSAERYEEVLTLAQVDPELNQRLQAEIAAVKEAQGSGS